MRPEILIQAGDLMELAASHLREAITLPDGTPSPAAAAAAPVSRGSAAHGATSDASHDLVPGAALVH